MHSTVDNLQIIYEDNHLLVVNKRPGDLVQGDKSGDVPLVDIAKDYLKLKYSKPGAVFLGVVHRLDRPTSGIVVFARTSKALSRLNELFKKRETDKIYWAVVNGSPPESEGLLQHFLLRNEKSNTSKAFDHEVKGSKLAQLYYRLLKKLDNYNVLEIKLITGRHHQIRAQLSAIGCNIKGDLKYGAARSNADGGIHLHARMLIITHPVTLQKISFIAPTPQNALWKSATLTID